MNEVRMQPVEASTRHTVRLPARVARQVRALAKSKGLSSSKVIAGLVETGLVAKERERLPAGLRRAHVEPEADRGFLAELGEILEHHAVVPPQRRRQP